MPMNVILLERVPKLGQMGDVVKVKPGFARNFLLPQKKALRATKDNITYFESQRKTLEAQNLERRGEAEAVGGKMSDLKVILIRQASEALQLYGSVSSRETTHRSTGIGTGTMRRSVGARRRGSARPTIPGRGGDGVDQQRESRGEQHRGVRIGVRTSGGRLAVLRRQLRDRAR